MWQMRRSLAAFMVASLSLPASPPPSTSPSGLRSLSGLRDSTSMIPDTYLGVLEPLDCPLDKAIGDGDIAQRLPSLELSSGIVEPFWSCLHLGDRSRGLNVCALRWRILRSFLCGNLPGDAVVLIHVLLLFAVRCSFQLDLIPHRQPRRSVQRQLPKGVGLRGARGLLSMSPTGALGPTELVARLSVGSGLSTTTEFSS